MYGKLAITCLKYQVYLYGSEAITYPHPPLQAALPTPCRAALPSPIWKRTLVWLNYHTYVKKQGENLYG